MRMFDKDEYVDDYKDFNLKLKNYNTPVILQVAHGGSQTSSMITGTIPVSASPTKNFYGERSKEIEDKEIEDIIDCFVKSVERAKKAEFAYLSSCLPFSIREEINGVGMLKIDLEY